MSFFRCSAFALFAGLLFIPTPKMQSAEPTKLATSSMKIEELPSDSKLAKVVLIAGSNYFKPGEHEYVAGCSVLSDLLRQTAGVAPVLAVDWPKKPETLAGAKAVVCFFDGGDKHPILAADRMAQLQKLADGGTGIVGFHQFVDVSKDLGDRMRGFSGAAWEKGFSQRAHWITEFSTFSDHPTFRGVTPFKIDDGWLFKLRFTPELQGVSPLLRTVNPKAASQTLNDEATVAWAYERPNGGRSFMFTGCHLHISLAQEGYRRFLVNGILWSAGIEIPKTGAAVALTIDDLNKYLKPAVAKSK